MTATTTPAFIEEWLRRVRAGEKLVQRCAACGHLQLHPRRRCNQCGGAQLSYQPVSGKARLYSFTTIHRNAPSDFVGNMPYTLAVARLAEGPQMLTRLVGCPEDKIMCDMPLRWTLASINGQELPCFEPDEQPGG